MTSSSRAIARKILSLPFLALGALFILSLSFVWLILFRSVEIGLPFMAVLGGLAALFLGIGLGLWGRAHRTIVGGIVLAGTGFHAAITSGFMALMLGGGMGDLAPPSEIDPEFGRSMVLGSAIAAVILLGSGAALLAPPIARLIRGRRSRTKPVLVWAVLAWKGFGLVGGISGMVFLLLGHPPLPPAMQEYIDTRSPLVYVMSLVLICLGFAGAIYLVRLRRSALWLFLAALVVGLASALLLGGFDLPPGYPVVLWFFVLLFGHAVQTAIIIYTWTLLRRGVLR